MLLAFLTTVRSLICMTVQLSHDLSQMISKVNTRETTSALSLTTIPDLDTGHGAEIWAKYINRITGRRSDAATGESISLLTVTQLN